MNQSDAKHICERYSILANSIGLSGYVQNFEAYKYIDDVIRRDTSFSSLDKIQDSASQLIELLKVLPEAIEMRQMELVEFFHRRGWVEFRHTQDPATEYHRCWDARARIQREARTAAVQECVSSELSHQLRQVEAGFPVGGYCRMSLLEDQKTALARGCTICEWCGQANDACDGDCHD